MLKPYAACRYCHRGMMLLWNLMNKYKVEPETIKSIEVSTYVLAVNINDHVLVANSFCKNEYSIIV